MLLHRPIYTDIIHLIIHLRLSVIGGLRRSVAA
jgi:hypothetical protein